MLLVTKLNVSQAKILYKAVPFPEDERESIKLKIQSSVYSYLGILLEGRERFEDDSLAEMKKQHCCGTDSSGTTEHASLITFYVLINLLHTFTDIRHTIVFFSSLI